MSSIKNIITPVSVIEPTGFTYFESPCKKMSFITINKCCSTSMIKWCKDNNWLPVQQKIDDQKRKYLVILRDPVERWISGFRTYLSIKNIDVKNIEDNYWKIFKEVVIFDTHTLPQYKHMISIKLKNIFAVDFNSVNDGDLSNFLRNNGYDFDMPRLNPTRLPDSEIDAHLKRIIDEDTLFRNQLHQTYEQDYWLRFHLLGKPVPDILYDKMVVLDT